MHCDDQCSAVLNVFDAQASQSCIGLFSFFGGVVDCHVVNNYEPHVRVFKMQAKSNFY